MNTTLKYTATFSVQGVAVAGTLTINKQQVQFEQNIVHQAAANRGINPQASVNVSAASVTYVGIQERTMNTLDGGLRQRLRIDTSDGDIYLFVIGKLEQRVEEIRNLLGPSRLATAEPRPYVDPAVSDEYQDMLADKLNIPKKQSLMKLFLYTLALCLVGPFLTIPFKSTTLSVITGMFLPIVLWILLVTYVDYRGGLAVLRHMIKNQHTQSGNNADSTAVGVNGLNMFMYKVKAMLKLIGGLIIFLVLGTLSSGIASGIIEGMAGA